MGFRSTFKESLGFLLPSVKGWTWLKVREEAGRGCAALVCLGIWGGLGVCGAAVVYYWVRR